MDLIRNFPLTGKQVLVDYIGYNTKSLNKLTKGEETNISCKIIPNNLCKYSTLTPLKDLSIDSEEEVKKRPDRWPRSTSAVIGHTPAT